MKYIVFIIGSIAALFFLYSVYAFIVKPDQFKTVAYLFMFISALFFIIVIIKKINEGKALKKKLSKPEDL